MAIKETPTHIREHYKDMMDVTAQKKEKLDEELKVLNEKIVNEKDKISKDIKKYEKHFKINLLDYKEFVDNKYIDGEFYKVAKGMYINRDNNYKIVSDLFDLYNFARHQERIHDIHKELELHNKILALSIKEYTEILRVFMTQVHKKMILEGKGYAFGNYIGWTCINRCVLVKPRPHIDYAATKKREKELKLKGIRIYNKREADWCEKNGIEYKSTDKRVFRTNEYCYEIPLINCKIFGAGGTKLQVADYRHSSIRGKTNEDLIKECNNDIEKICELPVDLKTKLTLCDKVNKHLYTKFIRNENQQPIATRKANRKNR